jgi:hypothetical protein
MSLDELPEEVCINMWSYLDFETVQKTCTLVCRRWFATIRNSGKLSGTLALDLEPMFSAEIRKNWKKGFREFEIVDQPSSQLKKSILSEWKQLHTLRFHAKLDDGIFDLTKISSLHKVIFGKRWDSNLVELNNQPWIYMSEIWYDPHEKSSRVDKILSELTEEETFQAAMILKEAIRNKNKLSETRPWRPKNKKDQKFFPEIAIQLAIELFEHEEKDHTEDQSLTEIVGKMENLESLFIDVKASWANHSMFDYCKPALNGLKFVSKLRELVVSIDGQFASNPPTLQIKFFDHLFAKYYSNFTRLKVQGEEHGLISMADLCWIPHLKNLEELSFRFNERLSCWMYPAFYELYYDNPMVKLKHFKVELINAFVDADFLINLHKAFPNLHSFTFISNGFFQEGWNHGWTVATLLGILKSLSRVPFLRISKLWLELETTSNGECTSEVFQAALEIIDLEFPKNSTELKIKANATENEPQFMITKEKDEAPKLVILRRSLRKGKKRKFHSIDQ